MKDSLTPAQMWGFALRFEGESDYITQNMPIVVFVQPLTDREAFRMTGRTSVYHLSVMIGSG